ncbi:MAG: isocitrate dehydrogenase (NADP(+)) [Bacteroidetes bacterium]|nr:isocitrate dehydrogenase (NADP(+)) [Bacteroidota bacterium]
MVKDSKISFPSADKKIVFENGKLLVPDFPIITFIEGDGIGADIWPAAKKVLDVAVKIAYAGKKKIEWLEVYAGEKSLKFYGGDNLLPDETIDVIDEFKMSIKGPLTTPISGGVRSLNVALRQKLDLYACVRPVKWYRNVPNPMKRPQDLDIVIFRENLEDNYTGIEWKRGDDSINKLEELLKSENTYKKIRFPESSNYSLKSVSKEGSIRIVRAAINFAVRNNRKSVTIVHKGNIMKFTEGKFKDWAYETALNEFRDFIITEDELWDQVKSPDGITPIKKEGAFAFLRNGNSAGNPGDKIVVKDRIADAVFLQLLLRPTEFDVLVMLNLNGDLLSDAAAAQVGGLGLAPGANINYETGVAVFEASHGSAPKYAGLDKVNPSSLILSGVMMLNHLEWNQAAQIIVDALEKTITAKTVTYDLARQMENSNEITCSKFADEIIKNMAV